MVPEIVFLAHLSRRLTRWAYSIPMVLRPSVVVRPSSVRCRPRFQTWISLKLVGQSWSNFIRSITGVGERLHRVWGRLNQNSGFHGDRKPPLTYNGENDVSTFSRLLLIRSFLYLQVTKTCLTSRTSSNFGQIGSLTMKLAALERLKNSHRLIMWKWCLHASSFIFDRIIIKLLVTRKGIKARTSLILGRLRLLASELLALEWQKFYTFELEYLWGQLANLDQILCVASLGVKKGCITFRGRLGQNSGFHGNRKPPFTYNWENGVSNFSQLLLIRSFLYLQVTRTCIKSQTSSNFGQIGPLTTELAALECFLGCFRSDPFCTCR